ncbi:MAG: hypothetical protein A2Y10_00725 [Planctomycetes bacterium GWF2_41_51]|nr:MAG: hypothetical protein A2Y10_00725 [Planctomycetes bacterium GWF2_41_51]HBG25910.1 hypothetical protein [Phycisphaerales bacterium]
MIAYNINPLCKQAELYYYDFLIAQSYESVPPLILDHIKECSACAENIRRLNEIVSSIEEDANLDVKHEPSAGAEWLKLHFDYLGKPVTCKNVKPFLPGFLDSIFKLEIPTPISVHLDNCPQCREDLEKIRELNLSQNQLSRLSRLLSEKPRVDILSCPKAQAAIPAVVSMALKDASKDTLKHLCVCPGCLKKLYQYREVVRKKYLESQTATEQEQQICKEASASDYFDYVIPYGFEPAHDQYAAFRYAFIYHASTCPVCLTKMQQMHDMIFEIAERENSEISTVYHIEHSDTYQEKYNGLPITVQVLKPEEVEVEKSERRQCFMSNNPVTQKGTAIKIKPLVKIGFAIAACVLVASGLLMNISTAKAVTLQNIYKAIERIKNVHIVSLVPDAEESVQERWVSKSLNVYLIKTDRESVLLDVTNKIKTTKSPNDSIFQTLPMAPEILNEAQNTINDSFGLMPFHYISDIPKDAQWIAVNDENLEAADGIEVYDLVWYKSFRANKCRFFVNPDTYLPEKIEFYQQLDGKRDYILKSIRTVEYLHDSDIQKILKESSLGN